MGRKLAWETLQPAEQKIAHLKLAGCSENIIAYLMEANQEHIQSVLAREHVRTYLLKLTALNDMDLAPRLKDVNETIADKAHRAFEVETTVMERLFGISDPEHKKFVQAQLGAACTAQDILDRAGKKAPTRIQQKIEYAVPEKTIEHLGRVIGEAFGQQAPAIDITPEDE